MLACTDKFKSRVIKCKKASTDCGRPMLDQEENAAQFELSKSYSAWSGKKLDYIIGSFLDELRDFDVTTKTLKSAVRKSMLLTKQAYLIGMCSCYFLISIKKKI